MRQVESLGVCVGGGRGGRKSELKKRVGGTLGSERSKRNRARRGGKVVVGGGGRWSDKWRGGLRMRRGKDREKRGRTGKGRRAEGRNIAVVH